MIDIDGNASAGIVIDGNASTGIVIDAGGESGGGGGGGSAYATAVMALSPVGYWKLNEPSGTTATDSSGNGNDGTYVGGVTLGTTGGVDTGVQLDGSSGYISLPFVLDPAATNFSACGWYYIDSAAAVDLAAFISQEDGTGTGTMWVGSAVQVGSLNRIATGLTYNPFLFIGPGISRQAWLFVAVTYDGSMVTVYVDGVEITNVSATTLSCDGAMIVGKSRDDVYAPLRVDGLCIFDFALSDTQVGDLYAAV